MPLQATSGAASYDAFGGGVPVVPTFIEDTFSCFLYTGNGSTQTITNNIDLSTKGGIVWCKGRSAAGYSNVVYDTINGVNKRVATNLTNALTTATASLTAFNTTGFSLGADAGGEVNENAINYVSWSLRKQPKFFDVVTFSTTNSANARISHNLGSVPACYIIKRLDGASNWFTYHTSLGRSAYLSLNATNASASATDCWGTSDPTTTDFGVNEQFFTNGTVGLSYVAYVFASNAGGFGLTGTDNVISCGSFTTSGGGVATVELGYEPQWLLIKSSSGTSGWDLIDNMRGMPNLGTYGDAIGLEANNSNAEGSRFPNCYPTATGFYYGRAASTTYIYIAIRRPMKVPTVGTSVFSPNISSGATGTAITTSFPVDLQLYRARLISARWYTVDRLRGVNSTTTANATPWVETQASSAEIASATVSRNWGNTGFEVPSVVGGVSSVFCSFQRAPSFFDEVCYTGDNSSGRTVTHNLGVAPELLIVKARSTSGKWTVYNAPRGNTAYMFLEETTASQTNISFWSNTTPTASNFTVNALGNVNGSGITYVAYLFATCAGVSKVGSYTGNAGNTVVVPCGFTSGVRFVLIKRTDSTGDWYVWDSARGIVSGNDPYLLFNDYAVEDASTDYVDSYSAGFEVTSTAPAGLNATGGTYIFLAIA